MAVKIKGGSFYFGKEADAPDAKFLEFFTWLTSKNNQLIWPYHKAFSEAQTFKREMFCYSNGSYWYGVVISAKTSMFQHVVKKEGEKIRIEARVIEGAPPVEINFFAIRTDSGKGIFSHYVSSYPFGEFTKDLWGTYRHFVDMKREAALILGSEPENEIKSAYSLHSKCLYGPLYSPKDFNELLDKLKRVENVRFTTYELDNEDDAPPTESDLKSRREIYSFSSQNQVTQAFKDWIKGMRSKAVKPLRHDRTKHTGKVFGYDMYNDPISIDFEKTLQNFLEYDYDQLGTIELENLYHHEIIQSIITKLSNDPIFLPTT